MKVASAFFLLFFILICFSVISQNKYTKFEKIDTEKGLPHGTVLCMIQDKTKFLWFGTKDGLCRYDFNKFITYRSRAGDKHSLSHNFIKSIVEDNDGRLWIGTWGGGLNMFDPRRESFFQFRHNRNDKKTIASDFINRVFKDSNGNIWIGTDNAGLDKLDIAKNEFTHFRSEYSDTSTLSNNTVRAIYEDRNHNIWIGTNNGLNKLDPRNKTFARYLNTDAGSSPRSIITDVYEDANKNLWITTYGGGLNLFDQTSHSFKSIKAEGQSLAKHLLCIKEDSKGNLWIGSENEGVYLYDPKTRVANQFLYDEADLFSISGNTINGIGTDEYDNLWFCTLNGGISVLNKDAEKFIHYRHNSDSKSLSDNKVISLLADSRSNVWIGTDGGGLNRLDKRSNTFVTYRHSPGNKSSIAGNYIRALCEGSDGNIWIGTWGDGITIFNPTKETWRHLRHRHAQASGLSSNNIWTIMEDDKKHLWIGTYDAGLNVFEPTSNTFEHYRHNQRKGSISSDKILSVYQDRDGDIWVGTDEGGLNLFDRETESFSSYKHIDSVNSLSNNSVGCILQDSRGFLWLGTNSGLNRFNKKTKSFKSYFTKDGLPNDVILGLLEDKKGNLWISTNNGLSKFDPQDNTFQNFSVFDGLQDNEFKENAYTKSRSGEFYFGGKNGFNEFVPENVVSKSYEPATVLTNLLIFNKPVPVADRATVESPLTSSITHTNSITISYKQSVISFEFASLHKLPYDRKRYQYMLEGFDNAWHTIGTNTVTYTNLDPGDYTFRVRGVNSHGDWSVKEARLQLVVTPPFWRTWWFTLGMLILSVSAVILFYKVKTRMIKTRNKILEMQVRERTQDIRMKSLEIERMNELLKADNQKLESNVEDITRARVMQKQLSFEEFKLIFPDDNSCLNHLALLKWKKGFVCKKCKNDTFAIWKNPYTRRCSKCRYIESATAFTIFHSVKFSVLKGFYLLFLIHSKPNITAEDLAQIAAISSKTCMTFKRKIKQLASQKKTRKKNLAWDDLIMLDTDEHGVIRQIKTLPRT